METKAKSARSPETESTKETIIYEAGRFSKLDFARFGFIFKLIARNASAADLCDWMQIYCRACPQLCCPTCFAGMSAYDLFGCVHLVQIDCDLQCFSLG